jgi:hypothetical protein
VVKNSRQFALWWGLPPQAFISFFYMLIGKLISSTFDVFHSVIKPFLYDFLSAIHRIYLYVT